MSMCCPGPGTLQRWSEGTCWGCLLFSPRTRSTGFPVGTVAVKHDGVEGVLPML